MNMYTKWCVWICAFATSVLWTNDADAEAKRKVEFNRDIRPILSNNCFLCHGPDENNREAELRLDVREGAVGEFGVIEPGKADKSLLVERITSKRPHRVMPPPKTNKSLTPEQIDLIKQWINEGAEYQGHWAFIPPTRPDVPTGENKSWARNAIDNFVLARLERNGLSPSATADRHRLIRRVTFDLTGLPPTPQDVQSFVNDDSPYAYEKVVDRLLASPHYGEHMARYWLDAVRYGDTHGMHLDNYREMWPYRDWVIRAFNNNKPFDEMTIEQIAGDLLPDASTDQKVASGYNRCHVSTNEGGSIREEVYVRNVVDRVETTATVWMGLTAGCAVCHDHKYDPLSQKEFYQLFAFFNNLDGSSMDGNRRDPPPTIQVPTMQQQREISALRASIASLQKQMKQREREVDAGFAKWLAKAAAKGSNTDVLAGLIGHFPLDEKSGRDVQGATSGEKTGKVVGKPAWQPGKFDGAFGSTGASYIDLGDMADFERDEQFSYGAWVRWTSGSGGAVLARMNDGNGHRGYDLYLVNGQVAAHIIHTWPNDALKVTTNAKIKRNKWHHLFVTYDGSSKPSGLTIYIDGKPQKVRVERDGLQNTVRTKTNLRIGRRNPGSAFTGLVDEVRFYDRRLPQSQVAVLAGSDPIAPILAVPTSERTPQQKAKLLRYYLTNKDTIYAKLHRQVEQLQGRMASLQKNFPTTLVMRERKDPRPAYLLIRGAYDNKGDKVSRETPEFLPKFDKQLPNNRLGFAKWLVSPTHPLTARVEVNRLWQQMFGTGIVKTQGDFGSQGEWPSHPELLDYLATEFVANGWDIKRLMRQMATSATYRQSAKASPDLHKKDPDNRLLARGPRFRLDGEMIRDQALAVSGLLVRRLGGPSVKIPQPKGLWYAVGYTSSNTARFKADNGKKIYRRSVYTFWKRTAPPPWMTTFDAPSREACTVRRERTNTPLQALLLMNEKQYFECARHFAERIVQNGGNSPGERVGYAFSLVASRKPTDMERRDLVAAYQNFKKAFQQQPEQAKKLAASGTVPVDPSIDPVELAAWTMVANVMLNLDEVVNK